MDLASEFECAELPDERLQERLRVIAERVQRSPSEAFPVAFGRGDELEGLYRVLSNQRVAASAVLGSHIAATVARCEAESAVIVVHDTTEFAFSGKRDGMYRLSGKRRGFCGHFSFALSADPSRRPLGVLAYATLKRAERSSGDRSWLENFNDPEKESLRWAEGVRVASAHLGGRASAVHVMDREGDSWELFEALVRTGVKFVIRLHHDRTTVDGEKISGALRGLNVVLTRDVALSARQASPAPDAGKKHPPRDERTTKLAVSAVPVEIRRPRHIDTGPDALPLHVVHVHEQEPPSGEDRVEWRLLTNLPIETTEEVASVVDVYRARWLIEEYFKALKTGCSFLKRQAESRVVLERILAIYAAAAWRLLLLRWVSRSSPDVPAQAVVTPTQLACLRHAAVRKPLSKHPTAREVTLAIAALGGHLPRNGDPGWQTLARGFEKLTEIEVGWMLREQAEIAARAPAATKEGEM
jgi:hypothetical protein